MLHFHNPTKQFSEVDSGRQGPGTSHFTEQIQSIVYIAYVIEVFSGVG